MMEPIVDPASAEILIPLEEWPVVVEVPSEAEQIPDAEGDARIDAEMAWYDAQQAEGQRYLEEKAAATAGMTLDELNDYCFRMEAWNAAVADAARHGDIE